MKLTYKHTMYAAFIGYIVQAIINNFVPLLFLTFVSTYGIPISKITLLVTFNFGVQLIVDLLATKFVDKIGYKISIVVAHIIIATGLISLTILPEVFSDPFIGLMLSVIIYAVGGGIIEVLISPIVEACPTDNKEAAMSLLHSFYCWGHVGVVLLSTVFFAVVGISKWKLLAIIWAIIPIINAFIFMKVPILHLIEEGEVGLSIRQLFSKRIFWIMVLLMVCSGASEQAIGQWTSTFAEKGLGVNKTIGDLAGPMLFAIMMGTSRVLQTKFGDKINIEKGMFYSTLLCIFSYYLVSLSSSPIIGLLGCSINGFSVGILWPGTFSLAAAEIRNGGTAMFALLALAGDLGCSMGPTVVGKVSGMFNDDIRKGILVASIFPMVLIIGIVINKCMKKSNNFVKEM